MSKIILTAKVTFGPGVQAVSGLFAFDAAQLCVLGSSSLRKLLSCEKEAVRKYLS